MTCAEQKALGPDASFRDVIGIVFHAVGFWVLGATVLLCCSAPLILKWWSRRVDNDLKRRYYFGGEHEGWSVQDPERGCPLADPRAWAEDEMRNGKSLEDLPLPWVTRSGMECVETIQKKVAVPLAIILSPLLCSLLLPAAIVVAFPLFSKLKIFHLERSIMWCMPLPRRGSHVPLSTYMLPLYASKTVYDVCGLLTKKWKSPTAISIGSVSVLQEWLALQVFDAYTDGSSLTSMAGRVPPWYFALWVVTSVASASVLVAAALWHLQGSVTQPRFFNLLLVQLVIEDMPQLLLSVLTLMLTDLDLDVNQYMIYNLVGNTLSCATLAKKLALSRDPTGSSDYQLAASDPQSADE